MIDKSRTRVLLSLSLSLFLQPSCIIRYSQFLCTTRFPHSLHPHMIDIPLLSTTPTRPHPSCTTGTTLALIWNLFVSPPLQSLSSLIIFPLHHFAHHLDSISPTLDRPNTIASIPLILHSPWFLFPSSGTPHRLYILRTRVISSINSK